MSIAVVEDHYISAAHERSAFAVLDPFYSSREFIPEPGLADKDNVPWLYGEAELECWRLSALIREMQAAGLKVGYPGRFHTPASRVTFRCDVESELASGKTVGIRAVGDVAVSIGTVEIYRNSASEELHRIVIPEGMSPGDWILNIDLMSDHGDPPGILIEDCVFSTAHAKWQWSDGGDRWSVPMRFPQIRSGVPPHRMELPELTLRPEIQSGEIIDFGRELFGRVVFSCEGRPALFVGESIAEALCGDPRDFEQLTTLAEGGSGRWISAHPLAFRYIRITGGALEDVECLVQFHPAKYRGAFACSDTILTRIWMNSSYTLRLCMRDFLIDGIKRDRLPWTGDLAMSMMANAYSFADAEIVRRTLTALGRAGISEKDINGIVDYSMWWIISEDLYQLYFADHEHLSREWPRVKKCLEHLRDRCDRDGLLRPKPDTWLFIDWVDVEKLTALQILWWWTQISGAALAERMREPACAKHWRERAESLAGVLYSKAWDYEVGAWRAHPDKPSEISRHANLLAVISGLPPSTHGAGIRNVLLGSDLTAVGTPYMKGFECMALNRLQETGKVLSVLRSYWGGMLDHGATTFWEAYDPEQKDESKYSFYGRPFAKSLCHAWSTGPAALLPSVVMGIRPTADGWKHFTVAPDLSGLEWACSTVPTPYGDIQVNIDLQNVSIHVPAGTTLEFRQRSYHGPVQVTENLDKCESRAGFAFKPNSKCEYPTLSVAADYEGHDRNSK